MGGNKSNIELKLGNIVHEDTDAIVNAANSSLLGGGGVDGAIHSAGGPQILEECLRIRERQGGCPPGQAVITGAGNLLSRFVIHTVGPIWRGGRQRETETLAMAYFNSLRLALENQVHTIAFPSISTGAYGFPVELAAPIALKTVKDFLEMHDPAGQLCVVRFVLFNDHAYKTYQAVLERAELGS